MAEGVSLGGLDIGDDHLGEQLQQVLEELVVLLLLSSRGKARVYHHLINQYYIMQSDAGKEKGRKEMIEEGGLSFEEVRVGGGEYGYGGKEEADCLQA